MLRDQPVDHLGVTVAPAFLGAVLPVRDGGLDLLLAGDGEFVDFLDGDHLGGGDWNPVFEEDGVGDVREPASTEDKFRVDVGQFLGSASARAGGVPRRTMSSSMRPMLSSASRMAPVVNWSTTFTDVSPLLLLGDVGEVRVVELPQRLEPVELALQVPLRSRSSSSSYPRRSVFRRSFVTLAVPTNLDALVTARL